MQIEAINLYKNETNRLCPNYVKLHLIKIYHFNNSDNFRYKVNDIQWLTHGKY